jgi:hypothetical protein
VAGSGFPTPLAVQPVTGNFFQTTQPVSIASPVAVTGSFPTPLAVQPISGAPTPIPTPPGGVYPISAATSLNVNIVGGSSSGATPIPFATNASGQLVIVAGTPLPVTGSFPTPLAVQPISVASAIPIFASTPLPVPRLRFQPRPVAFIRSLPRPH